MLSNATAVGRCNVLFCIYYSSGS